MRILPDYEHMEYRDVYTCRTYPHPQPHPGFRFCGEHGRDAAGRACHSGSGPGSGLTSLAFAGFHLLSGVPGAAIQMGWVSVAALGLGL